MTTPTTLPPLTPDTDMPAWETRLVKFLLVAVPVALSVWQPNGSFSSTSAQAVIVAAGVVLAGLLHLAELVAKNGLKKAGLLKTVSEYEAWIKANWTTLQQTLTAAQKAMATAPNLGDHLAGLDAAVADVQSKVAAVPAAQKTAAKEALQELFGGTAPAPTPAATAAPEVSPNPAPATPAA